MTPEALDWVERFARHLASERRLSGHTGSNYARDLRALVQWCDAQSIADWRGLDSQHVRLFAARSHARGLAPRSVQRRLSAVRSLFRHLIRDGELKHDPAADVQAPKTRKRLPVTLDADTMAKLLSFRSDEQLGVRDQAIMELFYSSGLRLAELLGLDLPDLDLRDRTVHLPRRGLPRGCRRVRRPSPRRGQERLPQSSACPLGRPKLCGPAGALLRRGTAKPG